MNGVSNFMATYGRGRSLTRYSGVTAVLGLCSQCRHPLFLVQSVSLNICTAVTASYCTAKLGQRCDRTRQWTHEQLNSALEDGQHRRTVVLFRHKRQRRRHRPPLTREFKGSCPAAMPSPAGHPRLGNYWGTGYIFCVFCWRCHFSLLDFEKFSSRAREKSYRLVSIQIC